MKNYSFIHRLKNESGQVLVLAALLMTVLMGVAAFAVDIGRVTVVKSHLQNAADAAALAGASAYDDDPEGTAENVLNSNGIYGANPDIKSIDINLVGGPGVTYEKAYSEAELLQMANELTAFYNGMDNEDLIIIAYEESLTQFLESTQGGEYTKADLEAKSETQLIELAIENSLTSYLNSKTEQRYVDPNVQKLRDDLDTWYSNKDDQKIKDYAVSQSPPIILDKNAFNNDNKRKEAVDFIFTTKYPNTEIEEITVYTSIKNNKRNEFLNKLVEKLNDNGEYNTITTIKNKTGLITTLVNNRIDKLRDDEIPVGGSNSNSKRVKVTLKKEVSYTFARILGFDDTVITVNAVAENKSAWDGEALPFINVAFDYSTTDPSAWTHVGPGVKGTITDFYVRNHGSPNVFYEVDYMDGITTDKGFSNPTGLNGIKLRTYLDDVITKADRGVKKFYIFSLSSDVIQSGQFTVNNKTKTVGITNNLNDLKNGDIIDPDQLVLIECLFIDCKWANLTDIELEFLGNVYDLGNNKPGHDLPDFPTNNLSSTGGKSMLVE